MCDCMGKVELYHSFPASARERKRGDFILSFLKSTLFLGGGGQNDFHLRQ